MKATAKCLSGKKSATRATHSGAEAPGTTDQRFPPILVDSPEEECLDATAGVGSRAHDPRRAHPGPIDHEQITRPQEVGEIREASRVSTACCAIAESGRS